MEREIISLLDHPFVPTLYSSFQVLKIHMYKIVLIPAFMAGRLLNFELFSRQELRQELMNHFRIVFPYLHRPITILISYLSKF